MLGEIENLKTIVKRLHKLNFGQDGIIHPVDGGANYNFERFLQNGGHKFVGEDRACATCDLPAYPRTPYVSHGSHTVDFVAAHLYDPDTQDVATASERACYEYISNWFAFGKAVTRPVLFLLENPADNNGNNYEKGQNRSPSVDWYWLDRGYKDKIENYDSKFIMPAEYGKMIFAVINTFHLANAYATNTVKCGVCNADGSYATTKNREKYSRNTIKQCETKWLKEEISALCQQEKNLVVLAFGNNAYSNFKQILTKENGKLYCYACEEKIAVTLVKFRHPSHAHLYCKEQICDTVNLILNQKSSIPYNNGYSNGYTWCVEYSDKYPDGTIVLRIGNADIEYKSQYVRYALKSGECDYWRGTKSNNANEKVFELVNFNEPDEKFNGLDGKILYTFRQLVISVNKILFGNERS